MALRTPLARAGWTLDTPTHRAHGHLRRTGVYTGISVALGFAVFGMLYPGSREDFFCGNLVGDRASVDLLDPLALSVCCCPRSSRKSVCCTRLDSPESQRVELLWEATVNILRALIVGLCWHFLRVRRSALY